MANLDLHSDISPAVAYNVAAVGANGTTNGNIIDTKDFGSLEFLLFVGARTDGTFTPLVQDGDDAALADAADVADSFLIGTEAAAAISAAQTVKRIGYVGKKRYVRLSVVASAVTTGATVGALAVKGHPDHAPVA